MIAFPYEMVHVLVIGSLVLTAIGAVVLLALITTDFIKRKIW